MLITKMKTTTFDKLNDKQWEEAAVKSLKGKPLEQLITKTLEGIDIQPLYTKENSNQDKTLDKRRLDTIRNGIHEQPWTIAQHHYATDSNTFMSELKESLDKGNEAIVYDGNRPVTWDAASLKELATFMQVYPIYAFDVKADDGILDAFSFVEDAKKKEVQGMVTGDVQALEGFHLVRGFEANTIPYHEKGADAVTELAIALAMAVEKTNSFTSFNAFSHQFSVRFAVDTHFFMEIAKLRAFRALWQTLARAYEHEKESRIPIYGETSLRTYSKLDPFVNLLRAGNETIAAALGGIDVFTVHPHNILEDVTPASVRYARNLQLVIKEETFLQYVLDPAGGSYFIDTLTNDLIEKAWALFQDIENQGGFTTYLESGVLDEKIEAVANQRMNQVAHRQKSLIGTNIYANLEDKITNTPGVKVVEGRLSQPYEDLRLHFQTSQPKVILLTYGALKEFKPRADFVTGYLSAAGISTELSPAFATVEEGRQWIKENDFDYGVICMPGKETEAMMDELITDLPKEKWLDVAGKYNEEKTKVWTEAGISGFIYQGQNQLEKFAFIKNRWEGR